MMNFKSGWKEETDYLQIKLTVKAHLIQGVMNKNPYNWVFFYYQKNERKYPKCPYSKHLVNKYLNTHVILK